MRRILVRSTVQRALLSVLVLLLAFGPVTVAFAAAGDEATEPATTDVAETQDTTAAEDSAADDAQTTAADAATEAPAADDATVPQDAAVEATAAEDDEVEAAQAPSDEGPYTPDPDAPDTPSGNGNGGDNGNRPCAGCVGNADGKNPPGQLPGPDDDGNNGYECDGNNGASQGNPAHSQCPEAVQAQPGVSITKNPDPQTIVAGATATWTIKVTNTGNVPLTGVDITDALAPDCDADFASLAVGASQEYSCSLTNVTTSFTNRVVVDTNENVTDDDTAAVIVTPAPRPGLSITKSPDEQQVQSGGTATWTITVTNTGNTDLTGVVVTDPRAPDCAETIGDLDIGDSESFTCSLTNVTASFTNVATADSNETGPVSDDAHVTVPNAPVADVSIEKAPDDQLLVAGETAEWDITVTNTGQVPLTGVSVSDQRAPDCNTTIGNLAIGASRTYDCELTNVRQSFTNVAVVSTNETPDKSDDADVRVVPAFENPSILLHKRASVEPGAVAGDLVTYEFDIINNGSVTLTNVRLNDPRVGGNVAILDTVLSPGEVTHHSGTVTYTLTQADINAGQVPNTAVTTGTPTTGGPDVSSTASALVLLEGEPDIALTKSGPTTANVGETITYTFSVQNTGTVTLTNVTVSDDRLGLTDVPVSPSTLAPGATGTASATYVVKESDAGKTIVNTAVAKGRAPDGNIVEDSDDHTVDVPLVPPALEPGIRLVKSGPARAEVGERVTYTFVVTNTGDVTLTKVRISDPLLDLRQLKVTPSTLAPGASGEASATYVVTPADGEAGRILNTAIATGTTPDDTPVRDDDDHDILVPLIPPGPGPEPDPDPEPGPDPDLPATGAASTGYALTALLSLMLGALFLRLAGSPAASTPSHFAQVLRGPDANSLHMMLRRLGLAPKPGGRQLR